MTDPDSDVDVPDGGFAQLKYSITNLWQSFGRTDSVLVAFMVNGMLALLGVLVFLTMDGIPSVLGAIWAILNTLPLVQWVLGL